MISRTCDAIASAVVEVSRKLGAPPSLNRFAWRDVNRRRAPVFVHPGTVREYLNVQGISGFRENVLKRSQSVG